MWLYVLFASFVTHGALSAAIDCCVASNINVRCGRCLWRSLKLAFAAAMSALSLALLCASAALLALWDDPLYVVDAKSLRALFGVIGVALLLPLCAAVVLSVGVAHERRDDEREAGQLQAMCTRTHSPRLPWLWQQCTAMLRRRVPRRRSDAAEYQDVPKEEEEADGSVSQRNTQMVSVLF